MPAKDKMMIFSYLRLAFKSVYCNILQTCSTRLQQYAAEILFKNCTVRSAYYEFWNSILFIPRISRWYQSWYKEIMMHSAFKILVPRTGTIPPTPHSSKNLTRKTILTVLIYTWHITHHHTYCHWCYNSKILHMYFTLCACGSRCLQIN